MPWSRGTCRLPLSHPSCSFKKKVCSFLRSSPDNIESSSISAFLPLQPKRVSSCWLVLLFASRRHYIFVPPLTYPICISSSYIRPRSICHVKRYNWRHLSFIFQTSERIIIVRSLCVYSLKPESTLTPSAFDFRLDSMSYIHRPEDIPAPYDSRGKIWLLLEPPSSSHRPENVG